MQVTYGTILEYRINKHVSHVVVTDVFVDDTIAYEVKDIRTEEQFVLSRQEIEEDYKVSKSACKLARQW